ncbi:hypothetical protein P691DRAFT_613590, partial [Macrolepiota fuliginosa MF-IS2]
PTLEILLCAFAAKGLRQTSGSTARNKIAALKAWHSANNWVWHGGDRLAQVLNGIHNMTPSSSIQPKRPPVTIQALELLALYLNHSDPVDVAILACTCMAFWGQCRLGKLIPISTTHFTNRLFPSWNSIQYSPNNHCTRVLHLPATKTNCQGQDIALVQQCGPTNPIKIMSLHTQINKSTPSMPLFSIKRQYDTLILTKKIFLNQCNQIWKGAGYTTFTGHSFRIRGTTHLLLSRVPPNVIKAMGHWLSNAFLRYWRAVDLIMP